ncbi:MAG: patatin-like phospholipase family protein [Actinomycetota bacterium]
MRQLRGALRQSVTEAVRPLTARLPGRRKIAFILSGGGGLGAVHVGMLRALVEAEVRPDLVLGCSVGAINGAGFAADPTLRGVARLDRIWRRLAQGDPELMPGGFIPLAVQLARRGASIHDAAPLEQLLVEELPVSTFEELRVRFQCVATDVELAAEHWFDGGSLVDALMASASLPAVYPSRWIDGIEYVDGGVLNEIHTERAVELGATELYVLHVGHLEERAIGVQRPFDGALRAFWTHRRFRYEEDLRRVPAHCIVHRLPAGGAATLRFDQFGHGPELAELAYRHTSAYLRTGVAPPPDGTDFAEDDDDAVDEGDDEFYASSDGFTEYPPTT